MKIHRLRWFVFALGLSITIAGCNKNNPAEKSLTIAVIPQGSTHEYWKSIHAGAMKAVQELSQTGTHVNIIWKGPLREDDREQQTQVVEGFISQGVQGIVLAPFDSHALVRPVEEAAQAGIPTVVVDSGLESQKVVSFISTDNKKGGALAADRMGELLHGKGKVLLLRQDIQKAGKVVFVGFDSSETFIEAMRNKQLQGIVVQDPFRMGELGVKTIVDHLQGKSVDKRVDTGATMVTPENMDTPEAQRVLRPPLAKYLGGL